MNLRIFAFNSLQIFFRIFPRPTPRIISTVVACPAKNFEQEYLAEQFVRFCSMNRLSGLDAEAIQKLFMNAGIEKRHMALLFGSFFYPPPGILMEDAIGKAVDLCKSLVELLLRQAELEPEQVSHIISSTSLYALPTLEARLSDLIDFPRDLQRTPVNGLGCMAGAAGIARGFHYLWGHREEVSISFAVEYCSILWNGSLQRDLNTQNAMILFLEELSRAVPRRDWSGLAAAAAARINSNEMAEIAEVLTYVRGLADIAGRVLQAAPGDSVQWSSIEDEIAYQARQTEMAGVKDLLEDLRGLAAGRPAAGGKANEMEAKIAACLNEQIGSRRDRIFREMISNVVSAALFSDGAGTVLMAGREHRKENPRKILPGWLVVPLFALYQKARAKLRTKPMGAYGSFLSLLRLMLRKFLFKKSAGDLHIWDAYSQISQGTTNIMGLRWVNSGLRNILEAEVPRQIKAYEARSEDEESRPGIRGLIDPLLKKNGLRSADIRFWLVHPGGPRVLDAIQEALELSDDDLRLSHEILKDFGNMSSATVLFILDRFIRLEKKPPRGSYGVMIAMGPGFSQEAVLLRWGVPRFERFLEAVTMTMALITLPLLVVLELIFDFL